MAVLRRAAPGRAVPARAALGGDPASAARPRPFTPVEHEPPVDELDGVPAPPHDRPPARLVQHRRAERRLHVAAPAAARRSTSRPRTRAARLGRGRGRAGVVAARRRWSRRCASTTTLRAGLVFMTLHFPDEVGDQRADDRRQGPQVGHGRVQGDGDPRRQAGATSRTAQPAGEGGAASGSALHGRGAGHRRRAGGRRRVLGPPTSGWDGGSATAPTGTPRSAATPRGPGGTCCCRRCTRCRSASAGSARARSTTSAHGSTSPPAEAYGVATFYALFSHEPRAAPRSCTSATTSPAR